MINFNGQVARVTLFGIYVDNDVKFAQHICKISFFTSDPEVLIKA